MILSFFKKPYPYHGDIKRDVPAFFFIGLFVALFLIVFEPFDINLWQTDHKILKLAGFGFVSFFIPTLITYAVLRPYVLFFLKEEKWTVGGEIAATLLVLLFIALGNLLYMCFLGIAGFNFSNFLSVLFITCIVGVFPVTFHVARKHNKMLRMNLEQSLALTKQLDLQQASSGTKEQHTSLQTSSPGSIIDLVADNEKDKLKLDAANLLYIESADNYCNVVHLNENRQKRELIRSTLKRIETQVTFNNNIVRCHRAYIVNLDKVKSVEGNAAGYKLHLFDSTDTVPVSRTYIPLVNERLKVAK